MKKIKNVLPKEVSAYISPYKVRKVRLLNKSERTKKLLEGIYSKEQLSILVTALDIVMCSESLRYFNLLLVDFGHVLHAESSKIFKSAEHISKELIPNELLEELQQLMKVSKAEEHGFIYNEKKDSYSFNANAFAKQFIRRCDIKSTRAGRLFLYNKKGFFEELSDVELGKVIRTLMHEGLWNSWDSKSEAEVVKALLRESSIVEEMNNMRSFINLRNGMLCLNTFKLLKHNPNYLSTVQLPIDYNPKASAPSFVKFIKDITSEDKELIHVHQEIMGYLLSAETKAEKAFFFHGGGANGKSVLVSIITQLIGKANVSSIPLSEFSQQFGLEGLINKTVNVAAENEMGGKALKTENFKAIVSGDTITINIKYRPAISYKPQCKLVFVINSLPDSMDVTNGYFRRLMIVPFHRTFKPKERNVNLTQELVGELSGILNWAIEGLRRLRENNYQFSQCKVIEECHQTYYAEQNPVKEFFHEHITLEEGSRTKQSDFHEKYMQWLNMQGIDDKGTKSKQIFWRFLKIIFESEGIPIIKKKVKGTIFFDGITIVGLDRPKILSNEMIQF
ncbi:phage/plasmid primase, P4 family [Priestia megaterium]|uniref:DNA primase family protein n=1 Tax=Priestia megaterium TaxID=1404 RepID=UPI002FDFBC69